MIAPRVRVALAQEIIDKAREDLAALYEYPPTASVPSLTRLVELVDEEAESL